MCLPGHAEGQRGSCLRRSTASGLSGCRCFGICHQRIAQERGKQAQKCSCLCSGQLYLLALATALQSAVGLYTSCPGPRNFPYDSGMCRGQLQVCWPLLFWPPEHLANKQTNTNAGMQHILLNTSAMLMRTGACQCMTRQGICRPIYGDPRQLHLASSCAHATESVFGCAGHYAPLHSCFTLLLSSWPSIRAYWLTEQPCTTLQVRKRPQGTPSGLALC